MWCKRNARRWLEDGECFMLTKDNGQTVEVMVNGMNGDYGGEVMYTVKELATGIQYPALEKVLKRKPVKAEGKRQ